MVDTWLVNGVDLAGVAHNIEASDGLFSAPGVLADDLPVAGWHGELDPHAEPGQQRRPIRPGVWSAQMWVLGVDPSTGALLDGQAGLIACQNRITALARLFHSRSLAITHQRHDGTSRRAVGHLSGDQIQFDVRPGSPWFGRFFVEVVLPDPFWYDTGSPVTASASVSTGGPIDLSPFAAASAPMRNCLIEFGPGSNPSLSHAGNTLSWLSVIASGQSLGVNTDPRDPALYAAAGAWTPSYLPLAYTPGPTWFELDPTVPTASLTHSGGSVMQVSVTAQLAHLTA